MKRTFIVLSGLLSTIAQAELAADWLSLASMTNGGTIQVDAGETKYVRMLNLRNEETIKTGEGTLAIFQTTGTRAVKVAGGKVVTLPPLVAAGESQPPWTQRASHLDASDSDSFVYADESTREITGWKPVGGISLNGACGITSSQGTSTDGNPHVVTDDGGRNWVDLGETGWMYFKDHATDDSSPLGQNRYREIFAVVKRRPGVTHGLAVFGTYNQWNRYCPAGDTTIMGTTPYSSDANNHATYLKWCEAEWTVNGRWVDPRVDNYGDDVQVIHVSLPSLSYFNAIGRDYNSSKGGFMIGEILCFGLELTPQQRIDTERYLLKKWKSTEHPFYVASAVALEQWQDTTDAASLELDSGASALSMGTLATSAAALTKTGTGTLTVGVLPAEIRALTVMDGNLAVSAYSRGPSAEVQTAMTDLETCIRIDASRMDTITFSESGDRKIETITDADGRTLTVGRYSGNSGTALCPTLVTAYQNGLPTIDMGPMASKLSDTALLALPQTQIIRSFYMVYQRYDDVYRTIAGPNGFNNEWMSGGESAIFAPASGNNYCKYSTLTIDGVEVANDAGGYPEGMHVFGRRNKSYDWSTAPLFTLGGNLSNGGGMYICEMIAGTADARSDTKAASGKAIETYLYDKWIAPKHCSLESLSMGATATLTLEGNVAFADASRLNFTTADETEIGQISVGGSVSFSGTGSVSIQHEGPRGLKVGSYPLIVCGSTLDVQNLSRWTITAPSGDGRRYRLETIGKNLMLNVLGTGTMVIFK